MKHVSLLIFVCWSIVTTTFGQSTECGDLKIVAPEYLDPWDSRSFSARTGTDKPITADWTLVKENYRTKRVEVETIRQKDSVKPQLWDSNDSGIVTAIATATSTSGCSMTTAVHTMVVERAGSPLIIMSTEKSARTLSEVDWIRPSLK